MNRSCGAAAAALALLSTGAVAAQQETTAVKQVDLRTSKLALRPLSRPLKLTSLKARYRYQIAGYARLLRVGKQLRSCIDTLASVEDRLDFVIRPNGALTSFTVRSSKQLQACLKPHVRRLTFPAFSGRHAYTLQVIIGTPGRKQRAKPKGVYPVTTPDERRRYSQAIFWVYSPWSMAISRCAEWVDRSLGHGYRVEVATAIDHGGQAVTLTLRVRGKRANAAMAKLAPCVVPFLRGLRAPRHGRDKHFIYKHGTSTAGWQGRGRTAAPAPRGRR